MSENSKPLSMLDDPAIREALKRIRKAGEANGVPIPPIIAALLDSMEFADATDEPIINLTGMGEGSGVRVSDAKLEFGNEPRDPKASRMANILCDAAEAKNPVEILLSSRPGGEPLIGVILAVHNELICMEVWIHQRLRDENGEHDGCAIARPPHPQQAYIDVMAIDAVLTMPGEYAKGAKE